MYKMLTNGNYASRVEDFEQVMEYNDFKALEEVVANEINNLTYKDAMYKDLYEREERHSDAQHQCIVSGYNMANDIIEYIQNAKRVNKTKLIEMLKELQNDLENY